MNPRLRTGESGELDGSVNILICESQISKVFRIVLTSHFVVIWSRYCVLLDLYNCTSALYLQELLSEQQSERQI